MAESIDDFMGAGSAFTEDQYLSDFHSHFGFDALTMKQLLTILAIEEREC
jgi:hypothetical protein